MAKTVTFEIPIAKLSHFSKEQRTELLELIRSEIQAAFEEREAIGYQTEES